MHPLISRPLEIFQDDVNFRSIREMSSPVSFEKGSTLVARAIPESNSSNPSHPNPRDISSRISLIEISLLELPPIIRRTEIGNCILDYEVQREGLRKSFFLRRSEED